MSTEDSTEGTSRWQPVMIYLRGGGRLECECGALAVVVVGTVSESYNQLSDVDHWCQSCYVKAQQKEME